MKFCATLFLMCVVSLPCLAQSQSQTNPNAWCTNGCPEEPKDSVPGPRNWHNRQKSDVGGNTQTQDMTAFVTEPQRDHFEEYMRMQLDLQAEIAKGQLKIEEAEAQNGRITAEAEMRHEETEQILANAEQQRVNNEMNLIPIAKEDADSRRLFAKHDGFRAHWGEPLEAAIGAVGMWANKSPIHISTSSAGGTSSANVGPVTSSSNSTSTSTSKSTSNPVVTATNTLNPVVNVPTTTSNPSPPPPPPPTGCSTRAAWCSAKP